jgi:hypothetical protein
MATGKHGRGQQIYHVGYTLSHSNTEVKQPWAKIVLGWETPKEFQVLLVPTKGSLSKACIGSLSSLWRYLSKKTWEGNMHD